MTSHKASSGILMIITYVKFGEFVRICLIKLVLLDIKKRIQQLNPETEATVLAFILSENWLLKVSKCMLLLN